MPLVSLSSVEVVGLHDLSVRPGQSSCRLLALPEEDYLHKAQVLEWCTRFPVLVHWAELVQLP